MNTESPSLSAARFPHVPASAGHYESFYLKAADPRHRRAVWIRYTVLKRPGEAERASLWCTLWPEDRSPLATKLTVGAERLSTGAGADAGTGELIRIGESRFSEERVAGAANDARWALAIEGGEPVLAYLPYAWMYRATIPRTKAVSLSPRALCSGEVELAGERLRLDDWPAMVGHNWGSEHAEEWIWLHGAGFPEDADAWFDVTIGRVRVGRFVLPWIANGCLALRGRRHRLGGPRTQRATIVRAEPTACDFELRGSGVSIRGRAAAATGQLVAWPYSDPGGDGHYATNCSVASLELEVERDGDLRSRCVSPPGPPTSSAAARSPPARRSSRFPTRDRVWREFGSAMRLCAIVCNARASAPLAWPAPVDALEDLLAQQSRYYRDRAPEYDDWWFRRGRYDHGEKANDRWAAEGGRGGSGPRGVPP